MLRMAHRLQSQNLVIAARFEAGRKCAQEAVNSAREGPSIIVDNVFDFLERSKRWNRAYLEEPLNLAPPFPVVTFEWNTGAECMMAVVVETICMTHMTSPRRLEVLAACRDSLGIEAEVYADIERRARWILQMNYFVTNLDKPACGRVLWMGVQSHCFVGEKGEYITAGNQSPGGATLEDDAQIFVESCVSRVVFFALTFVNCKNVEQGDATDSHGPPAKWLRRQKQPRIVYKVLKLDAATQKRAADDDHEPTGIERSLHICRGHFATYTAKAPLFGKYEGTFWVPQHMRGQAKHGVVLKDYEVAGVQ